MNKSLKNKYWALIIGCFSLLLNCSTRENEDYKILNIVINEEIKIAPKYSLNRWNNYYDKEYDNIYKKHLDSSVVDAIILSNLDNKYKYSFTLKDSLFAVPNDLNDPYSSRMWGETVDIKKYTEKERLQLEKLHFKKNFKLLKSETDTIYYKNYIYLGSFSFSRVLYDNSGNGAFVRIKYNTQNIGFVKLEKKDGKWIAIK